MTPLEPRPLVIADAAALVMANHASTHMTQLCDRRSDNIRLDEVELVLIKANRARPDHV